MSWFSKTFKKVTRKIFGGGGSSAVATPVAAPAVAAPAVAAPSQSETTSVITKDSNVSAPKAKGKKKLTIQVGTGTGVNL